MPRPDSLNRRKLAVKVHDHSVEVHLRRNDGGGWHIEKILVEGFPTYRFPFEPFKTEDEALAEASGIADELIRSK